MKFMSTIKAFGARTKYGVQKNAPTILLIAGVALDIFTLYQTVKKVSKVKEIIKDHNEKLEEIHNDEQMTEQEQKKAVRHQYISTTGKVAKEVAVPAATFIMAKGCYVASVDILKTRYVAAVGLYESTKTAFDQYRRNNIELNGEEADATCMYGPEHEIVNVAPEDEGGAVTKETIRDTEQAIEDINTIIFDEESSLFERDGLLNHHTLENKQAWINRSYKAKGFISLYDIVCDLDLDRNLTGDQIIKMRSLGRVWDDSKSDVENDLFFDIDGKQNARACVGAENVYILHMNCDQVLENVMPRNKQPGIWSRVCKMK